MNLSSKHKVHAHEYALSMCILRSLCERYQKRNRQMPKTDREREKDIEQDSSSSGCIVQHGQN